MSTTPDQPQEPERKPEPSQEEAADARDALRDLADKPHSDEAGPTAYSAVPPPLPPTGEPNQQQPQQSPYQQQPQQPQQPQDQPPYGQQPYSGQPPYGQPQHGQQPAYGGAQSGGAQYGGAQSGGAQYGGGPYGGPYQAAPPPPPYGQAYGYAGAGLPPGMPPLADWGQRAGAFALDNGPVIVAGWVAGATRSVTVEVVFGILCFFGLIWAIMNAVQAGSTGQSYGKRTLGIRLARFSDGQPIGGGLGFLRAFLNWLFWVACIIPGILNLLWPLWDVRHQTWSDKIAGSVVVRAR